MNIEKLRSAIQPFRQTLLGHPIYKDMGSVAALRAFMEHHVFAVWDFMSLLKTLQLRLSGMSIPWLPNPLSTSSLGSHLINEIVLAEESDQDGQGGFASHFELYHRAMIRCGARTDSIDRFLAAVRAGASIPRALQQAEVQESIRQFVTHTFETIDSGDLCGIAAAFTFGREDLLPDVFQKIVDETSQEAHGTLDDFQFYLRRHIQLDGDQHGPMAARLISSLCGTDESKWRRAEDAAATSLQARIDFWNSIHDAIRARNKSPKPENRQAAWPPHGA